MGQDDKAGEKKMIRRELPALEKQLYAREETDLIKRRADEIGRLGAKENQAAEEYANAQHAPRIYRDLQKERLRKWRKALKIILAAAAVLALLAAVTGGFIWYRLRMSVNADQLRIKVAAPEAVTSGEEINYQVEYGNDSYVGWVNVELEIEVPVGFQVTSIPDGATLSGHRYTVVIGKLEKGEVRSMVLSGRLVGELSSSAKAQAKMYASPENYQKVRFDKSSLVSTTIIGVPLDLTLESPSRVMPGEKVLVAVTATNTSEEPISDGYLQLNVPAGMQTVTEDPQFSTGFSVVNSRWDLPEIEPYGTVKRQALIVIDGQPGDKRILEILLGIKSGENSFVQQTQSAIVMLTAPELEIEQQYNGSSEPTVAAAGERIKGIISYRNAGQVALQDVVVEAKIEGQAFDISTLKLSGGAFDTAKGTITWRAASLPQLAVLQPQAEGQIEYEFMLKNTDAFPLDETAVNNVVVIGAKIDSPTATSTGQQASGNDRHVISVRSNLTLETTAFYDDGRMGIKSSGPTPPEVGKETTYTVRLRAGSTLNALGDARVTVVLTDGARYTNTIIKTSGEVSFNDRTGEISWNLAQIPAGAGRLTTAEELYFQVAIVPAENQRGEYIRFMNKAEASATDMFTESELRTELRDLPDTSTASGRAGAVR